jgi:hypothetical protein
LSIGSIGSILSIGRKGTTLRTKSA